MEQRGLDLIDPELRAWLPRLPVFDLRDVAGARATAARTTRRKPVPGEERLTVREHTVHAQEPDRTIRVREYRLPSGNQPSAAVIFMHGGAFVMGTLETHHDMGVRAALSTGCPVFSVEYRLAPEDPFPAALHDCLAVVGWVSGRDDVDPLRVAVAGISAGATLAAAVALYARDTGGPPLCHQWLAQPLLDDRPQGGSRQTFADDPLFNAESARLAWDHYLSGTTDISPYAAPVRADDLRGLPPAYISVGGADPLRDEGIAYATRLIEAGVPVELHVFPGAFHGSQRIEAAAISARILREWDESMRRAVA